jgi:hypothetical protein
VVHPAGNGAAVSGSSCLRIRGALLWRAVFLDELFRRAFEGGLQPRLLRFLEGRGFVL